VLREPQAQKRPDLKLDNLANLAFSFVTVVVAWEQLVKLVVSVDLRFVFLHNPFNDALVGGEVREPVV
jgi:hypothetical protein